MEKKTIINYVNNILFNTEKGKFLNQRLNEKYLKAHGMFDALNNYYKDSGSLLETAYRIHNELDVRPVCKICGKPVNFIKSHGFGQWCSPKCRNNDPEVLAKNKIEVSKSLKEVYQNRGKEIKRKRAGTLKKKFNTDGTSSSPFSSKEIQEKAKKTVNEKYGVDNVF